MNEVTSGGEANRGRALVELGECELPTRSNSSAVHRTRRQSWAQASSHWRNMNVASYGVMQKRLRPSPECHAREMRNEKGGLGSNTHQRNILPILPLFALIVAPIQRFQRRVDIIVNRNRFGALSSGCCVYQQRRVNVLGPEGRIVGWKEQDEHRIQMQICQQWDGGGVQ